MTPYVSYKMYWAARQPTSAEQRLADEQVGRLSASLSDAIARLRLPHRPGVRRASYGVAQCECAAQR